MEKVLNFIEHDVFVKHYAPGGNKVQKMQFLT